MSVHTGFNAFYTHSMMHTTSVSPGLGILLIIFHQDSNSMEISFCCNSIPNNHIATYFRQCHGSRAVVSCTIFVAIAQCEFVWKPNDIFIEFELWRKRSYNRTDSRCTIQRRFKFQNRATTLHHFMLYLTVLWCHQTIKRALCLKLCCFTWHNFTS